MSPLSCHLCSSIAPAARHDLSHAASLPNFSAATFGKVAWVKEGIQQMKSIEFNRIQWDLMEHELNEAFSLGDIFFLHYVFTLGSRLRAVERMPGSVGSPGYSNRTCQGHRPLTFNFFCSAADRSPASGKDIAFPSRPCKAPTGAETCRGMAAVFQDLARMFTTGWGMRPKVCAGTKEKSSTSLRGKSSHNLRATPGCPPLTSSCGWLTEPGESCAALSHTVCMSSLHCTKVGLQITRLNTCPQLKPLSVFPCHTWEVILWNP